MRRRRGAHPVLITSATTSRPQDIRDRERRYVKAMLFRTVCFILAVVLFQGWARFVAMGIAVITPWLAVVFANGGPKRTRQQPSLYTSPAAKPRVELDDGQHPVVEHDPNG